MAYVDLIWLKDEDINERQNETFNIRNDVLISIMTRFTDLSVRSASRCYGYL